MPGASSYKAVYVLRALVFCLDPYSLPLCLSRQTSLGGRKKKKTSSASAFHSARLFPSPSRCSGKISHGS